MTSISTLAVAAPVVHTAVNSNAQPVAAPVSTSNYLGGAAIAVVFTVLAISGLSAAGILKHRRAASTHRRATRTAH